MIELRRKWEKTDKTCIRPNDFPVFLIAEHDKNRTIRYLVLRISSIALKTKLPKHVKQNG